MELLNSIGISEQQLIQAGLDLAGYLASAGLTLMLYVSFLNRRARKAEMASYSDTKKAEIKSEGAKDRTSNNSGGSFMRFKSAGEPTVAPVNDYSVSAGEECEASSDFADEASSRFKRNRSEVIRLARRMLDAGNSPDRVADLLPLSESEMRLVRLGAGAEGQ